MKVIYLSILIVLYSIPALGQNKFSQKEVVEDLDYLRKSLEEAHYNLYAYVTKKSFNENFTKVKTSITKDSLTILEATSLFQKVVSKVNNGHTNIPFPGAEYYKYGESGGTLFPLELAFENSKAFVKKNLSNNNGIDIGSEIISINGLNINEVLERIFPLISAERRYFKFAQIELFSFPRYYWLAFGEQTDFVVEIMNKEGYQKHELKSVDVFDGFENKRTDIFAYSKELRFLGNVAYLRPAHFGGDEQEFAQFIDSSFVEIKKRNVPNLIIDLRNNLGGDNSISDYLVSYIADKPFRWYSEFSLKTSAILKAHVRENYDTTNVFWKSVLTHEDGTIYPFEFEEYMPQPQHTRYTGEVYVLVNRQSHSMSAVAAAQIQDYNFATVVGEETGDFPSLLASQYGHNLPKTGIEVKISKGYIVRVNGSKKPEGVIPDIYIQDHLLDDDDEILDGLLNQLGKKN